MKEYKYDIGIYEKSLEGVFENKEEALKYIDRDIFNRINCIIIECEFEMA